MTVIPWPRKLTRTRAPQATAAAAEAGPLPADELADLVTTLIQSRQTVLPKGLGAPGPDAEQLGRILAAAAHAPDHGQLLPWRFVLVPGASRAPLAEVFAAALHERDPAATDRQLGQAREKAHRAPVLLLVVVDSTRGNADIGLDERVASAGCAVQNMLLMATAQGFGSAVTSGKALKAEALRVLFGLAPGEQALCFVSIGTVLSRKAARTRPSVGDYVSTLHAQRGVLPGLG